jgi:peptidyl-Lys metalloendopeptidase
MNDKTQGDIWGLSFTSHCKSGAGGFLEQFSKRSVIQVLLLAVWLIGSGVQAQTNTLRAELKVTDPNSLQIAYTLVNESKQDLQVLTWNTPLEGAFNNDYFDVSFDGKKELVSVPYRERHMKRAAASAEDYILLSAGDSISIDLDISHGYLTERVGYYSIQFDGLVEYYAIPVATNASEYKFDVTDRFQKNLQSNEVVAYQSLSFAAIEAKLPPTFSSCDADQQTQIDTALTAAEAMATEAAEALNSTTVGQRAAATRYTTWFGSYLSSRYTTVSTHFNAIQDATANKALKFSCGSPRCGRTTFAFVYSNSPYEVFLCPAFWGAELTGTDSRAGTIIHELSHFTILGGTDDHQYGQSSAKQLGATDPNKAINNADSHEYFAENTPALSMSGGTTAPGVPEPSPVNETLTLGASVTSNLESGQWLYYEVSGASEISLFNMSADIDLYIGNSARPTASNYQCRPFSGGTTSETCNVDASKKTFIGVQGVAGSFSLVANAAPVSGGETGSGSSGDGSQTLSLDIPVTGSVEANGWTYFQVTGAAEISLFNLSADLDLYIGEGENPTAESHVCRPFSSGTTEETCPINDASATTFIGVNAFSDAGTFSLIARQQGATPTSNALSLSVGVPATGMLDAGTWEYFEVTGASSIKLFDLSADLDLYVSRTGTPAGEQYDCRPYSSGSTEEICSLDPSGTSYIGVKAFEGGSYSLLATADSGSDGGGTALTIGQTVTANAVTGEWVYYQVTGANSVKLFDLSSDLDLYVSRAGTPTTEQYDCRPFSGASTEEICSLDPEGISYIGINALGGGSYSLLATSDTVSGGSGTPAGNTALTIGQAVTGSVAAGEWLYYEVANVTEVSLYGLTADLDLYVSTSGQPSDSNYICRPFTPGDNLETCSITARGTIIIGVNGFDSGSFSLVANNSAAMSIGEAVVMEVNQEVLVAGDPLFVTMTITGDQSFDTYAALILPSGDLFTFSPQGDVRADSEGVIAFHNSLQVNGEQTHTILNTTLPSGLPSGVWQACGVLIRSGLQFAVENSLGLNCVNFMVNPSSGKVAPNTSKGKRKKSK